MAKINFTAARVNGHSCPEGKSQSFIWDSGASGLGLRATAAGARSYIWQGKLSGDTVRVSIGDPRDWGINDARDEARRLKRLVDAGKDPREEAAAQRAAHEARKVEARRQSALVGEAWGEYLDHLRKAISPKTKKPRSPRYLADHEALAAPGGEPLKRGKGETVRGPLASLMDLKLSDLTAARIAAWLQAEAQVRPTNAAHAFRLLRAFIGWAAEHDVYAGAVSSDACTSKRVTGQVPQSKAKPGGTLQREQLAAWFRAVRALDNPIHAAYLQALLLTGARREELAWLRWDDVDFRWRTLHLADKIETQVGRVISLPPYLSSLLTALPRRNAWVFSSPAAASGRLQEPRFAHDKALVAAGLAHITLHDLRRSFKTMCEWGEIPAGVTAQLMGHRASALVEKHYARRSVDLLRKWHDSLEAWILGEAGIEFDAGGAQPGLRAVK